MRYKNTTKEKENGVVYTPTLMADYVADEMLKRAAIKQKQIIEILDPAVGEGELIISLVNKLIFLEINAIKVVGYETDYEVAKKTEERIKELFPEIKVEIRQEDFLLAVENNNIEKFDFVIANPPYVRTQILGSDKAQELSEKLGLSGRVDIYYAFLLCTKSVLKPDGVSGYITSNKFLTIKSGVSVRNFLLKNFLIYQITDLGDTKLFNASVLPCILIFGLGKTIDASKVKFTSVYETDEKSDNEITDIFSVINKEGVFKLPDTKRFEFKQGVLASVEENDLWTIESANIKNWLAKVEKKIKLRFDDIGKIRVGIKTTADNVFINPKMPDLEWIRPLITHRNAGQILPSNSDLWKVIYTHTVVDGKKKALLLDSAPKTKEYLLNYYDQLSGREYIKKAKRNWYEIWVPQNPESWEHRKIVFRDISEKPQFWLDESGAIVNGDCYWIDIDKNVSEDIVYLALAIANSSFIEKYYDHKFNTKLYSGKRRFMTQYVEQFPIPDIQNAYAKKVIEIVRKIVTQKKINYSSELDEINSLIEKIFN